MLYRRGVQSIADFLQELVTFLPVVVINPDLDQLMAFETNADFLEDRFCESVLADRHDGLQGVGTRTQGASLVSSDFEHWLEPFKTRILQGLLL